MIRGRLEDVLHLLELLLRMGVLKPDDTVEVKLPGEDSQDNPRESREDTGDAGTSSQGEMLGIRVEPGATDELKRYIRELLERGVDLPPGLRQLVQEPGESAGRRMREPVGLEPPLPPGLQELLPTPQPARPGGLVEAGEGELVEAVRSWIRVYGLHRRSS